MSNLLAELAELLRYPDAGYAARLDQACATPAPAAARALLERFREQTAALSAQQLQELYTATFDLSPLCSLEVGWQLYGEDYARGSFLVYVRSKLLEHDLAERGELPDHLANVLALIARMRPEPADEIRQGAALPAIRKMLQPFAGKQNPYGDLLRAIAGLLEAPDTAPDTAPGTAAGTAAVEEMSHV